MLQVSIYMRIWVKRYSHPNAGKLHVGQESGRFAERRRRAEGGGGSGKNRSIIQYTLNGVRNQCQRFEYFFNKPLSKVTIKEDLCTGWNKILFFFHNPDYIIDIFKTDLIDAFSINQIIYFFIVELIPSLRRKIEDQFWMTSLEKKQRWFW
jgi:hypothetical protein